MIEGAITENKRFTKNNSSYFLSKTKIRDTDQLKCSILLCTMVYVVLPNLFPIYHITLTKLNKQYRNNTIDYTSYEALYCILTESGILYKITQQVRFGWKGTQSSKWHRKYNASVIAMHHYQWQSKGGISLWSLHDKKVLLGSFPFSFFRDYPINYSLALCKNIPNESWRDSISIEG